MAHHLPTLHPALPLTVPCEAIAPLRVLDPLLFSLLNLDLNNVAGMYLTGSSYA
jgi:hypothetical protein